MTYVCEDGGERTGTSFMFPRSHDDLVKRRTSMKIWADATHGRPLHRADDVRECVEDTHLVCGNGTGGLRGEGVPRYQLFLPRVYDPRGRGAGPRDTSLHY
jgi:hypothetical protein